MRLPVIVEHDKMYHTEASELSYAEGLVGKIHQSLGVVME
jgi:hypothetical protein